MKCKACGAEITNDAKFCDFCGTKVEESQNVDNESVDANATTKDNEKKYSAKEMVDKIANFITYGLSAVSLIMIIGASFGFFDKNPIPFIIFVAVVFVAEKLEEKLPKFPTIFFAIFEIIALIVCFNIGNNVGAVLSVKEGSPNQYPNITYERAFEDYFVNPTWEACGKDEDGNEVVMFTGTCEYLGSDAIAEIKFTVYKDQESFVVSSVKLNGQDMDLLGNVLVMDVFEEYQMMKDGIATSETYTETYLEESNTYEEDIVEESVLEQTETVEMSDGFLGLTGDYICTNAEEGGWTGRIQVLEITESELTFQVGSINYDGPQNLLTATAYLEDESTAIYDDGYGFSMTLSWIDPENFWVGFIGELTGTDSGVLMDYLDDRYYYREPEFNQ